MDYLTIIFFIYGVCIGSFLNVVIYRMPIEKNIAKGRSFCPKCNKQLTAIELIPILSWLVQSGKCRNCKTKISVIYPVIELCIGLLFILAYSLYGVSIYTFIVIIFWSMLVVIGIIDYKTKFIYDSTLIATILPIFILSLFNDTNVINQCISAFICFFIYFLIYKIAYKFYGREAFGFGDVLLISIVGYVVNIKLIYLTIFLPSYIAILLYLLNLFFSRFFNKNRILDFKTEIAFGPSIAISGFILTVFSAEAGNILNFIF